MSDHDATGEVVRLFREIGLDDDDPDSHMVRYRHPSWPHRCASCGGGLFERPSKRDPEHDIPLCGACYRYRVQFLAAKEQKRDNRKNTVAAREWT